MIVVDENEPVGEVESQFGHRRVTFKRNKDVRAVFEMIDEIGRGKFGRVMKCRKKDNGEIFAAKFVTCTRREDRRNVEREVEIMNNLKSSKLLQLFEAYDNGRSEMCLITEYIGGGELFDRVIEDEFVLSEKACCIFMKQILEGVHYIHRQQIIHLDLKPENILCLTRSGNRVKIIDFGLARKFEPMKKLQILFGTPEFVAPEVVNFEPIGYTTDMWALGVITYVLVSGLSPFMGDTDLETMANVTIAEYDYEDEAFDNVSDNAKDFIDNLLVKDQGKRATAEACLKHSWLHSTLEETKNVDQKKEKSNNLAKDNLNHQKTAWNNRDSNYYLFDSKSRTASQLYEMNLCLSPKVLNIGTCKEDEADEADDKFSFFSADGTVRCDSNLQVNPEGNVEVKENSEPIRDSDEGVSDSFRKRSLENGPPRDEVEETIEYQGLVKRPKTPLITACDIAKQAAAICERKASACGSLPDVVSSSTLENNEMSGSRHSLVSEPQQQSDEEYKQSQNSHNPTHDELPLPDIVTNDEENNTVDTLADFSTASKIEISKSMSPIPPILIEDHEPWIETNVDTNAISISPIVNSPCPEESIRNQIICHPDTLIVQCTDATSEGDEEMSISPVSHLSDDLVTEEPNVMSPCPVIKNYTVEDGFERPSGGWCDEEPIELVTEVLEEECDIYCAVSEREGEDEEEDEDENSSSSSSLPSESSGIFYRAEYTAPATNSPMKPNLLSVDNRDAYWKKFFNKNPSAEREISCPNELQKCVSGGSKLLYEEPDRLHPCKSKSDAAINYIQHGSSTYLEREKLCELPETNLLATGNEFEEAQFAEVPTENNLESASSQELDQIDNETEQIVLPKIAKSSSDEDRLSNRLLTETSSRLSPENNSSHDQLSTTISKEMQDLLSSIQSLGEHDRSENQGNALILERKSGGLETHRQRKDGLQDKKVDMNKLLQEVEEQIRFSATAELLERIAKCPSIESMCQAAREIEVKGQKKAFSPSKLSNPQILTAANICEEEKRPSNESICTQNDPIDNLRIPPDLPDLIRPTMNPSPNELGPTNNNYMSSVGDSCNTSSDQTMKRRFTSLPRPSEMPSSPQVKSQVVQVPDMLARVSCHGCDTKWKSQYSTQNGNTDNLNVNPQLDHGNNRKFTNENVNYNNYINVCEDLSQVRTSIDNLKDIISSTKSEIQNNSKPLMDIFEKCHFYTHPPTGELANGQVVSSNQSLENDLRETNNAIKEIERTVSKFSRHVSLPTGKADPVNINNNSRKIFSNARRGSVTKTKEKYEQQAMESKIPVPLNGQRQRGTTPFSKTRSPSPSVHTLNPKRNISVTPQPDSPDSNMSFRGRTVTGNKLSLRKRSPSPVVTGKVSSFRNKFENNPTKANIEATATMPRTFRFKSREPSEVIGQNTSLSPDASSSRVLPLPSAINNRRESSLSRQSSGNRLPDHFVGIESSKSKSNITENGNYGLYSSGNCRPQAGRTSQQSRTPRLSEDGTSATKNAVEFLRATLPRKSLPNTSPSECHHLRGPFGYKNI